MSATVVMANYVMAETTSLESSFSVVSFPAICASFITIGATASFFGPLVNATAARFHESIAVAGISLSVYFVGAFIGVLGGWWLVRNYNGRRTLVLGLALLAGGGALVTIATTLRGWPLYCAAVALMGAGFGVLDFGINSILARSAESQRAHRMSLANSFWGVGSILGPLLIVLVRPKNFELLFAIVATLAVLLTPLVTGVSAPPLRSVPSTLQRPRWALATFCVALISYVAVESAASGWIATDIHSRGFSQSVASLSTAGFWLGLTIGRALGGRLHRIMSAQQLVEGGLGLSALCALAATQRPLAVGAFCLLGAALASVFVFGMLWYQEIVGDDNNGISIIIIWAMLGGAIGPAVTSWCVSAAGSGVIPWAIAGFSVLTLGLFFTAHRFARLR